MKKYWIEAEALREMPEERPSQEILFRTWNELKK
jgi:hypothetical protein